MESFSTKGNSFYLDTEILLKGKKLWFLFTVTLSIYQKKINNEFKNSEIYCIHKHQKDKVELFLPADIWLYDRKFVLRILD